MKFLIVTEAWEPQINGVVRTYQNLKREMEGLGHEVAVIGPNDFTLNMPCPTYPDIRLAFPLPRELEKKIEAAKADRIHIATEGPLGYAAARYCVKNHIPYTTAYHTHFAQYIAERMPVARKFFEEKAEVWIRHFHNMAAGVMTVSPKMDDYLRGIGVTAPTIRLDRGVDLDVFHPGASDFLPDDGPVALYAGRIAKEKNIAAFLDLDIPHTKVVVGDGPQRAELEGRYPDAVFTGFREGRDLAEAYRRADVVVFPSKTDTFGIVVIEALACGKPVAAFSGEGGHTVILREEFTGSAKPSLRDAFNAAAAAPGTPEQRHEYVRENYSWKTAAKQFMDAAPEIKETDMVFRSRWKNLQKFKRLASLARPSRWTTSRSSSLEQPQQDRPALPSP